MKSEILVSILVLILKVNKKELQQWMHNLDLVHWVYSDFKVGYADYVNVIIATCALIGFRCGNAIKIQTVTATTRIVTECLIWNWYNIS